MVISLVSFFGACHSENKSTESDSVHRLKDSIPPAESFIIESTTYELSQLPPPETRSAGIPEKIPAPQITQRAVDPEVRSIQLSVIQIITPGKNGVPQPAELKVEIEQWAAPEPSIRVAGAPVFKDNATQHITYLDVEQGLSNSRPLVVLEDSRAYLWFGALDGGLCRYDGHSFAYYGHYEDPKFSVIALLEDEQEQLWIASHYGVLRFDGLNFTYFTNDQIGQTREMIQDSEQRIWLASEGNGLFCLDGDKWLHFTTAQGLPHNYITSIAMDKAGHIWVGTEGGLSQYDGTSFTNFTTENGLATNVVIDVIPSQKGGLWVGTVDGLSYFNQNTFSNYYREEGMDFSEVTSLKEAADGTLWIGTFGEGVHSFDGTNFTHYTKAEGFSGGFVSHIEEDSSGQIWVTTEGQGVYTIKPNSFQNWTANEGLPFVPTDGILEDSKGNLWMAVETGTIKYDGQFFQYYTEEQNMIPGVHVMMEDHASNIWFAAYADVGLVKYDGTNFTRYTVNQGLNSNTILGLLEDKQHNIWIGTDDGFNKMDSMSITQYAAGRNDTYFHHPLEDMEGHIWWASDGVWRLDGEVCTIYREEQGLKANNITTIKTDQTGRLWAGTVNGLGRFNGEYFTSFSKENGVKNILNWSLLIDKRDNLWLGTENGLQLLEFPSDTNEYQKPKVTYFDKRDGLKTSDFRHNGEHIDHTNHFWWSTGKAVTRLDIDHFYQHRASEAPRIDLHHFFINNKSLEKATEVHDIDYTTLEGFHHLPNGLTVPYDANFFSFHFVGIDWHAPHKVQYQYQLEGLENTWSEANPENKADYRALSHGTYTFRVRAIGEAGIWSEPTTYSFTIRPPFWHTWVAYLVYFLLFLGLIYAIFIFLKRRLTLQNQLKSEQEEAARLKELDSFKSKLYTNLTHEFRTPLTIILGMAEQIEKQPKNHLEEGVRLIKRNGKNLLRLINQLLDLSKLENKSFQLHLRQDDIIPYLRYVVEAFQSYAASKNLALHFWSSEETLVMDYDAEQIKQVMSNLISNAVKFTPENGAIHIRVQVANEQLQIEIQDTGIGIAAKDLPNIFDRFYQVDGSTTRQGEGTGIGLAHTQELVRLMGGEISVKSELEKGSQFLLRLPIQQTAMVIADETTSKQTDLFPNIELRPKPIIHSRIKYGTSSQAKRPSAVHRLLIIEDNPDVVVYLKTCLEEFYQIDVAYNGKIGIEKAIENTPDLIISDVMMPEKDGLEVCDTLKNDERTSHIPIILLTAKADITSKLAGLKRGADAYLAKPFHKEELLIRLDRLVAKQKRLTTYFSKLFQAESVHAVDEVPEAIEIKIEDVFIQKVRKIVEDNYENEYFGLPQLCQKIAMSRSQLYRKMKALADVSPSDFIKKYRLQKAKDLLEAGEVNVAEAAYDVGFSDPSYFSKIFQKEFGVLPSEMNK